MKNTQDFLNLFVKAVEAGKEAADNAPTGDLDGFHNMKVSARTKFGKWLLTSGNARKGETGVMFPMHGVGQGGGKSSAYFHAASKVLNENGIKTKHSSWSY